MLKFLFSRHCLLGAYTPCCDLFPHIPFKSTLLYVIYLDNNILTTSLDSDVTPWMPGRQAATGPQPGVNFRSVCLDEILRRASLLIPVLSGRSNSCQYVSGDRPCNMLAVSYIFSCHSCRACSCPCSAIIAVGLEVYVADFVLSNSDP